jgi:hypothetical protein
VSSNYEDHLQRQLRAFAAALARILGLRSAGAAEEARVALDQTYRALLGDLHDLLRSVDSVTAAGMLFVPGRIAGYARLVREEAELTQDPAQAGALRRRALELGLEARLRGHDDPTFAPFLFELADRGAEAALSPVHRELLARLRTPDLPPERPRAVDFPLDRPNDG